MNAYKRLLQDSVDLAKSRDTRTIKKLRDVLSKKKDEIKNLKDAKKKVSQVGINEI